MSHCHSSFLPYLLPYMWHDFIVLITTVKPLEFAGPEIHKIQQDILKEKMKPLPWKLLRLYSNGIGSEGLWPQLVHCAPFLSIAQYFRKLYVSYL
jgi:hypothetical protein